MEIKPFLTAEDIRLLQEQEARSDVPQKRTAEQIQAIYSHGSHILVSASAGSGKTFVMIERIFDMIERGYHIDQLFISTFTVKAAGELKERLEKKINQALTQPRTDQERHHLSQQIQQLPLADIGTMDAFTHKLVSQYAYLLGISPNFRIIQEQSQLKLLQDDVFHDLFNSYMTGSSGHLFRQLVRNFIGKAKDSRPFQELVYDVYRFSQSMAHPQLWLEETFLKGYDHFLKRENFPDQLVTEFLECLATTAAALQDVIDSPDYDVLTKAGKPKADYKKKKEQIATLVQAKLNWEQGLERDLAQLAKSLTQALPATKTITVKGISYPIFQELHQYLDQFRHLDVIVTYQEQARPILVLLQAFMKDFSAQFLAAKIQENAFEFTDISHFAISILEDYPQVRQQFQDKYQEVMVDEYQDNNHLQEQLLELLSNGHNRFMVGDIKQSIYRFRQSDPQIFKDQFERFRAHPDQGQLILLKENFRSQSTVLATTNAVFRRLMDDSLGDVRYDQGHQLLAGSQQQLCSEAKYQSQLLLYDDSQEQAASAGQLDIGEIDVVAKEIIRLYREEKVSFDQISLLVPSRRYNDTIMRTLESYGIPVVVDEMAKNYLQSVEVMVMLDTLRVVNNPLNDYALIALLRSPMFAFNEDDLARIALQSEEPIKFYEKLQLSLSQEGQALNLLTEELVEKIQAFDQTLRRWRQQAKLSSLYHLIWQIYQDKYYYDYVGGQPNGAQAQANLYALAERAYGYEEGGFKGLTRFIQMIDKILANAHDLANVDLLVSTQAVNLMTIHKSKGLEFDYVFILNLFQQFNKQEERQYYALSREWGLGIRYLADLKAEVETFLPSLPVRIETVAFQQIKEDNQVADLSERLRLLYVAMTRARKKLYLVGKESQEKFSSMEALATTAEGYLTAKVRRGMTSFQDWILGLLATFPKEGFNLTESFLGIDDLTPEQIGQVELLDLDVAEVVSQSPNQVFKQALADMECALNYNHQFAASIDLPSVRTPSQMKEFYKPVSDQEGVDLIEKPDLPLNFDLPTFSRQSKVSQTALGSATHELMQRLVLSDRVEKTDLQEALQAVQAEKKVKDRLDLEKLYQFFQTDLGKLLQEHHDQVQREAPFSMLQKDPISREKYIIRGILDGYVVLADRIVLFDYKTDRFKDSQVLVNRYRAQMALYAQALSRSYQIDRVDKYLILLGGQELVISRV
ncbi:helicase-exonuclease AddAB subunit AddA [Streptococcus cuniculipharyngis]|uniref:DNA 3'-5' helicase n=1 Tax=Streptococcus cuniculipharyngis TaxID=1562651 RepID=A0A5C5SCH7_9STRE|nr:helicase-exonuclease AddAB subunit AddA [Streptococcus cuniculipharyngis]TWS98249.1 helicase-exonuclease AddAB subunit AddA [Streptococcus cuniculipharyngis]